MRGANKIKDPPEVPWGATIPWHPQPGSKSCDWTRSAAVPRLSWTKRIARRESGKKANLGMVTPHGDGVAGVGSEERRGVPAAHRQRGAEEVGDLAHGRRGSPAKGGAW